MRGKVRKGEDTFGLLKAFWRRNDARSFGGVQLRLAS